MPCHQHGNVSARFQCPGCKGLWCPECVVRPEYEHTASSFCPGCGGLVRAIAPTHIPTEEERFGIHYEEPAPVEGNFVGDLWRAFLFPLRPKVFLTMMLVSTVFFLSPICARGIVGLALWMVLVVATLGLVSNYLADIIVSVGMGDEDLPDLQWFDNFIIDGVFPGSRALFLLTVCFGALPSFAYNDATQQGLLVVLGTSFFFPVTWLGSALTRSINGALHPALFGLLRRISLPYILTYLTMVIGLGGCYALFRVLVSHDDGIAYIGVFPLISYFLFVMSFMLGKLVYHHQEEFEEAGFF